MTDVKKFYKAVLSVSIKNIQAKLEILYNM